MLKTMKIITQNQNEGFETQTIVATAILLVVNGRKYNIALNQENGNINIRKEQPIRENFSVTPICSNVIELN